MLTSSEFDVQGFGEAWRSGEGRNEAGPSTALLDIGPTLVIDEEKMCFLGREAHCVLLSTDIGPAVRAESSAT